MEEYSSLAPSRINKYAAKSYKVWWKWRTFPAQEVLYGWGKKTEFQVGLCSANDYKSYWWHCRMTSKVTKDGWEETRNKSEDEKW